MAASVGQAPARRLRVLAKLASQSVRSWSSKLVSCGGEHEGMAPDSALQARCVASVERHTALHGLDARQGDVARPPRGMRGSKDSPMRIAGFYCACSLPSRDTAVAPVLVLIIIVIVYGAAILGGARAVMTVVIAAVLTAAVQELVRAAALRSEPGSA